MSGHAVTILHCDLAGNALAFAREASVKVIGGFYGE